MSEKTTIVKGGFRATLAFLISIVALILAIVAFNRTGGEADLKAQIRDLHVKMKTLKKETAERVNKVRQETAKTLERIGIEVSKEELDREGIKTGEKVPEKVPAEGKKSGATGQQGFTASKRSIEWCKINGV